MKCVIVLCTLAAIIATCRSTHLVLGNVSDRVILADHTKQQYVAFPGFKRVKHYFYNGNLPIQGIQALDDLHSKGSINITAGGLGHTFVNFRMKSERGVGLDYDIGIYVAPAYN